MYGFFKEQGNASLKKSPCFENLETGDFVNSILIYLATAAKETHFCDCSRNKGRFCGVESRHAVAFRGSTTPNTFVSLQIVFCPVKFI